MPCFPFSCKTTMPGLEKLKEEPLSAYDLNNFDNQQHQTSFDPVAFKNGNSLAKMPLTSPPPKPKQIGGLKKSFSGSLNMSKKEARHSSSSNNTTGSDAGAKNDSMTSLGSASGAGGKLAGLVGKKKSVAKPNKGRFKLKYMNVTDR